MQKKIIALEVAGLVSGAAYAQTNVTIYGVADAGYTYFSIDDSKFSGIQSGGRNGSRVGFRGEEALGNGLKAIFTYEFGTSLDTNAGINSTCLVFVGLSGSFGAVTFGRRASPTYLFLGRANANDITSVHPTNLMLDNADVFKTLSTGGNGRWDNSIAYNSPNWSGFDVHTIYSFGETDRDSFGDASKDASKVGIGVSYTNGLLYLTAMYQGVLDTSDDIDDGSNGWAIGGNYDFKVVKVYANYIHEKFGDDDIRDKHSLWYVGVGILVSKAGTVPRIHAV
jgi:predicted porin